MKIPDKFKTVTKTSKILALVLFIFLPFIGFVLGVKFERSTKQLRYNEKESICCGELVSLKKDISDNFQGEKNTTTNSKIDTLVTTDKSQIEGVKTKDVDLNTFIKYELPNGWIKDEITDGVRDGVTGEIKKDTLSFITKDFELNGWPAIIKGAKIWVQRHLYDDKLSVDENIYKIVRNGTQYPENIEGKLVEVNIGDKTWVNLTACWETCLDIYFIKHDNYIWDVWFDCACEPYCYSKADFNSSVYSKDRDSFLKSFSFK